MRIKFKLKNEIILKEYFKNKLSCKEIADKYKTDHQMVRYHLKKSGKRLRNNSDARTVKFCKSKIKKGFAWCNSCEKQKSFINFSKNKNSNNGYESSCKDCKSEYSKKYFPKRNKKRLLLKAVFVKYKGNKCHRCKINDIPLSAFQFHHLNPDKKDFQVSLKMKDDKRTRKEIDKCILVCANCHHIIHFGDTKLSDVQGDLK